MRYDGPHDDDYPESFSENEYMARAYRFAARLWEECIPVIQLYDSRLDDEKYTIDLLLELGGYYKNFGTYEHKAFIRFSHFGRLATIYVDVFKNIDVKRIARLLDEEGFEYIPEEILRQPYDGVLDFVDTDGSRDS